MENSFRIVTNDNGNEIVETNYFRPNFNPTNLFQLSYSGTCFHLLIPPKLKKTIKEMRTGKYAIISVGYHKLLKTEMIEIMFEDFTRTPYAIHISQCQSTCIIDSSFNNSKMVFKGYSENGKVLEMDVYIRSDPQYQLPYLKPLNDIEYIMNNVEIQQEIKELTSDGKVSRVFEFSDFDGKIRMLSF